MFKRWMMLGLLFALVGANGAEPAALGPNEPECPKGGSDKADVVYKSDGAIKRTFQNKLAGLLKAGETVDPETLVEQLGRTGRLKVNLLPAGTAVKSPAGIYRDHKQGVVTVGYLYLCGKCDKQHLGCATGFVLSTNGIVATNYHLIDGEKQRLALGVMTGGGEVYAIREILAADKEGDVALVKIDAEGLAPLALAANEPVGSEVAVLSHPAGRFYTLTDGIISRYSRRMVNGKPEVEMGITADFARGSSGGPVFNNRGAVVGMVKSTRSIYYTRENGADTKLQMVVKTCVPAETILALYENNGQ